MRLHDAFGQVRVEKALESSHALIDVQSAGCEHIVQGAGRTAMDENGLRARMMFEIGQVANIWVTFTELAWRLVVDPVMIEAIAFKNRDLFITHDDKRLKLTTAGVRLLGKVPQRPRFVRQGDPQGYLKVCCDCARLIYLHHDYDGAWRPYASWVAGDVDEGVWERHPCTRWETRSEQTRPTTAELGEIDVTLKQLQQLMTSSEAHTPVGEELVTEMLKNIQLRLVLVRKRLGLEE